LPDTSAIASFLYKTFSVLSLYFSPIGKSNFKSHRRSSSGKSYALITGYSGGIGFALAQQLVKRGFGVIIPAHIPDELYQAAADLREFQGADVHCIVLNGETTTPEVIKEALEPVLGLYIRIVVNNVGGIPMSLPYSVQ
jgi:NAD(P)-dependent dehydrogenase (short-subunit alcohol dehydrogenase family)